MKWAIFAVKSAMLNTYLLQGIFFLCLNVDCTVYYILLVLLLWNELRSMLVLYSYFYRNEVITQSALTLYIECTGSNVLIYHTNIKLLNIMMKNVKHNECINSIKLAVSTFDTEIKRTFNFSFFNTVCFINHNC